MRCLVVVETDVVLCLLSVSSDMLPDVERIIESIVQGDQDTVQLLLDGYNTQVTVAMATVSVSH